MCLTGSGARGVRARRMVQCPLGSRLWTSLNCTLGQSVNFFDDTSTLAYEADKLIHVPIPCDISVHQWKDVADTQSVTQTRAHVMRRME